MSPPFSYVEVKMEDVRHGSCLCGRVRYRVNGPMRGVIACHCTQCRKQSGHFYAATDAPEHAVEIVGGESIKWYQSSPRARRGFCGNCGSALFWKQEGSADISILAGSLDGATGLRLERHIFCADKGDYYAIDDGLPQLEQW